jgi:hypothetical protein
MEENFIDTDSIIDIPSMCISNIVNKMSSMLMDDFWVSLEIAYDYFKEE